MSNYHIRIAGLLGWLFITTSLAGQSGFIPDDLSGYEKNLALDHHLYSLANLEKRIDRDAFTSFAQQHFAMRLDGRMVFSMVNNHSSSFIDTTYLTNLGLEVMNARGRRAKCAVDPGRLTALSTSLQEGYFMESITQEPTNNEGPGVMNTTTYVNEVGGAGIRVGIIDYNFDQYLNAGNQVPAILPGHFMDFTGNGLNGLNPHGTACAEIVFDHAPDAEYFIIRINNDSVDWLDAMELAADSAIQIISCSMGPHNLGWNDNSGYACAASTYAANNGMLFFTSAGNEAQNHWKGPFVDDDGDDLHEWDTATEGNEFMLASNALGQVWLQWNSSPPGDAYDLSVHVNDLTYHSSNSNKFEHVIIQNQSNQPITCSIEVESNQSNTPEFQIFVDGLIINSLQFQVSASSVESPANCTHDNIISVGAVSTVDYDAANNSEVITSYSSQGPTLEGQLAPDICAPTGCTTFAYNGPFTGTSCAAPNAAGAAAALWSAHPDYTPDGIRQLLLRKAQLYRDWGSAGNDNIYGRGGLYLHGYGSNDFYVYSSSGNNTGTYSLPFSSIIQALQYSTHNSRIIFLGETYELDPGGQLFNSTRTLLSAGRDRNSVMQ